MTIEELFGTLQQAVVASWRKHLRAAKYSKHEALNDFYEEIPDLVDKLIEDWMGVNGKKIKEYNNIIQSKNMNTLSYLKELRRIAKQGYVLMNGEKELEADLDSIIDLIDTTMYKVKELNENRHMGLKEFLKESLSIIEESKDAEIKKDTINIIKTLSKGLNSNDKKALKTAAEQLVDANKKFIEDYDEPGYVIGSLRFVDAPRFMDKSDCIDGWALLAADFNDGSDVMTFVWDPGYEDWDMDSSYEG